MFSPFDPGTISLPLSFLRVHYTYMPWNVFVLFVWRFASCANENSSVSVVKASRFSVLWRSLALDQKQAQIVIVITAPCVSISADGAGLLGQEAPNPKPRIPHRSLTRVPTSEPF